MVKQGLYFSQVSIDKEFTNAYDLHQFLWRLFPDRPDAKSHFLYSIENVESNRTDLIVRSQSQPILGSKNCSLKVRGPIFVSTDLQTAKANTIVFSRDSLFSFKLTGNPTKKISDRNNKTNDNGEVRKLRVPLYEKDEQLSWLKRKLFESANIMDIYIKNKPAIYFNKKQHSGKIFAVQYEGLLEINDAEKFANAFLNGIGPAKAFGCGLLLLKRL